MESGESESEEHDKAERPIEELSPPLRHAIEVTLARAASERRAWAVSLD